MSRRDRCGCGGGGGGATKSLEQQVNKPVLLANERGKVEAETFVLQIQAINFFWALRVTGMTLQLSQSLSGVMWVSQPASQQRGHGRKRTNRPDVYQLGLLGGTGSKRNSRDQGFLRGGSDDATQRRSLE